MHLRSVAASSESASIECILKTFTCLLFYCYQKSKNSTCWPSVTFRILPLAMLRIDPSNQQWHSALRVSTWTPGNDIQRYLFSVKKTEKKQIWKEREFFPFNCWCLRVVPQLLTNWPSSRIDYRHTYADTNSLSLSLLFDSLSMSQPSPSLLPHRTAGILSNPSLPPPFSGSLFQSLFLPFFTAAEQCGSVAMATSHSVFSHPPYFTRPSTLTHSLFSLQSGRTIKICQQDSIKRVAAGGGMGTSETGRRKNRNGASWEV